MRNRNMRESELVCNIVGSKSTYEESKRVRGSHRPETCYSSKSTYEESKLAVGRRAGGTIGCSKSTYEESKPELMGQPLEEIIKFEVYL